ncbi:PhoH family protein [Thermoproteus tenax]|uniref:PhoH-related protein n=1 Tax=Thermoproteus tenax (strain ATCC 35583 / DSM 2078 / JCM 9277 / NBRC 100435 / Kra 1) TaxID=768679 RepID=G4RPY1_THETK|nr:PhoH family protein [Thermoproteus tenax]CCC81626.1 phoH-related protein [Thermoproteus tenax Kra 1]
MLDKIKPQTIGQERALNALSDSENEVVGLFGPTGTGKSLLSIAYGIDSTQKGKYKRFIIARPVVDVSSGRSLTPENLGEMYYKLAAAYLSDILGEFLERSEIEKMLREETIVVTDVNYLRGRTFDDSIIFLDDAQNVQPDSAAEILLRIGRNSKLVIAGDPVFQRAEGETDGATLLREALLGEEKAAVVDLGVKDIVRPGARRGIKLALELRMRKRKLSDVERYILDSFRVYAPDADIVTVVEFKSDKDSLGIKGDLPDALVFVKEGHLGRAVGRGGERIKNVENDTGLRLRLVEMTLDFKNWVRSLHPAGWISKHIVDADFAGPELLVTVRKSEFGSFVGHRGAYVRLMDRVFRRLLSIGVRAVEAEEER